VRAARESAEMARWAIERLFAQPMGELRRTVEQGRREQLTTEIDLLESIVAEADNALRGRDWKQVSEAIDRAELAGRRAFETLVDTRWREVEAETARTGPATPGEAARREEVRTRVQDLRRARDYTAALEAVRTELEIMRRRRREQVEARIAELKAQLWVGERLGLDTTPVMQTFSEARVAVDGGSLTEAEALYRRANESLEHSILEPFRRRQSDLLTEINFAADGLRVSVGPVRVRFDEIERLAVAGQALEAARLLLAAEEELALRKSLHRELMNLHYLIDAALARAAERRLDTTEARALVAESVRLRDTDYAAALEKARDALRRLQVEIPPAPASPAAAEPAPAAATAPAEKATANPPGGSTPFWPFRRSPPSN
jgi:hypothetical protein